MNQYQFSNEFLNTIKSLKLNKLFSKDWIFKGKTDIAFGTPNGPWDVDGYLFEKKDKSFSYVLRSIPSENSSSFIVLESINIKGQLYNMDLKNHKTFKEDNGLTYLLESYRMTVGKGKKKEIEVKECFESFGIKTNEINILNDVKPDWIQTLTNVLEWAILREKVKIKLKNKILKNDKDISIPLVTNLFDMPINQILYGPPGTGKTYKTKELSVKIANPKFNIDVLWNDEQKRDEIIKEYDNLYESGQIVFTTFHQSISYEEFIEGIKPFTNGKNVNYKIENGIFKEICKSASDFEFEVGHKIGKYEIKKISNEMIYLLKPESGSIVPIPKYLIKELVDLVSNEIISIDDIKNKLASEKMLATTEKYIVNGYANIFALLVEEKIKFNKNEKNYVLIIDEINRGNISSIFGELITLLEKDKRLGEKEQIRIKLPYSKKDFGVPQNLYIIGTMNTADRSVEALDIALRRRFSFTEVMPNPKKIEGKIIDEIELSKLLETINKRIEILLDRDHTIGHAYFMKIQTIEDLRNTFKKSIIPLLQEYFYKDYEKIGWVLGQGFFEEIKVDKKSIFTDFFKQQKPDFEVTYKLADIDTIDIKNAMLQLLGNYKEEPKPQDIEN